MAKTFDQSADEIARLVKHYRTNRVAFHAPGYKEAHARQNLIDPLFSARFTSNRWPPRSNSTRG